MVYACQNLFLGGTGLLLSPITQSVSTLGETVASSPDTSVYSAGLKTAADALGQLCVKVGGSVSRFARLFADGMVSRAYCRMGTPCVRTETTVENISREKKDELFRLSLQDNPDPSVLSVIEKAIRAHRGELLDRPIDCDAKIIEQPTWGGTSILEKKGLLDSPEWRGKKVGQAYENHALLPVKTGDGWTFSILDVSLVLGEEFLGSVAFKAVPAMGQLRKDTEAYGNSYQMHLDEPAWIIRNGKKTLLIPKGEAMRYLDEPGLLTCGVKCKTDEDWADFERRLRTIDVGMKALSEKVLAKEITLDAAKASVKELVRDNNPYVWVGLLAPKPGEVVDFSTPRRHHNWEEVNETTKELFQVAGYDPNVFSEIRANRLDEIQTGLFVDIEGRVLNLPKVTAGQFSGLSLAEKRKYVVVLTDDNSSIRGFDKGKFKADGSLRPLDLDTYFHYIDRRPEMNVPESAIVGPKVETLEGGTVTRYAFDTDKYAFTVIETSRLNPSRKYTASFHGEFSDTSKGYHHIYADHGPVLITFKSGRAPIVVKQGYSVFLNATLGAYGVNPLNSGEKATVSVTYVPGKKE